MWDVLLQIVMVLAPSPKGVDRAGPMTVFGMTLYHTWIKGHRSRQNLGSCVFAWASAPATVVYLLTSAVLTYWCKYSQIQIEMQIASLSKVITVDSNLSAFCLNVYDLSEVF